MIFGLVWFGLVWFGLVKWENTCWLSNHPSDTSEIILHCLWICFFYFVWLSWFGLVWVNTCQLSTHPSDTSQIILHCSILMGLDQELDLLRFFYKILVWFCSIWFGMAKWVNACWLYTRFKPSDTLENLLRCCTCHTSNTFALLRPA